MVFLEILILISAISVTLAPSLIRSALFLMVTFLLSGLFLASVGAELLALLFLLVYIGAISVLFLFVIMLIQLTRNQIRQYLMNPLGLEEHTSFEISVAVTTLLFIIILVFTVFFTLSYSFPISYNFSTALKYPDFGKELYETSTVYSLGAALFIDYWFAFIVTAYIITAASFGVIVILK